MPDALIYPDECFAIVGAAIAVRDELGHGFLEAVYEAAMIEECKLRGIPIQEQVKLGIAYKGIPLSPTYIADLVAYGKIIIELKAIRKIGQVEEAQIVNYLKATGMRLGILVNFGAPAALEWRRLVN
ncbi:MAG: GxxExxY protein [Spirochaetaceae bacterium]|nr:GxxExxY protein [Spirochaetaceae bacterium]